MSERPSPITYVMLALLLLAFPAEAAGGGVDLSVSAGGGDAAAPRTSRGEEPGDRGLFIWTSASGPTAPKPLEVAVGRLDAGRLVSVTDVELRASIGDVRMLPRGSEDPLVRAVYRPPPYAGEGPLDVELYAAEGGDETRTALRLVPGMMGSVRVEVSRERIVKGVDGEAVVTATVMDADGEAVPERPPRLTVNVGSLSELVPAGEPGRWTARYTPGPARYPEVAVFAALAAWPHEDSPAVAFGHATLPLLAAIDLPGEVRPRVRVTVEIGAESFGPVSSDRLGRFEVPVVVPPGHGRARGMSVDRFGNRRETSIDLRLPPTNRLTGAVHPPALVAGGSSLARLVVLAVDAHGSPCDEASPRATARLGSTTDLVNRGGGVFVGWYRPPELIEGDASDQVVVDLPGDPRSRATLEVTLLSGAPARLKKVVWPDAARMDGESVAPVELRLLDERGSPVDGILVEAAAVDGRFIERVRAEGKVEVEAPGGVSFDYLPPEEPAGWEDEITLRAIPAAGRRAVRLVLDEASGEMAVVDHADRPVPGVAVELGGEPLESDDRGRLGPPPEGASRIEAMIPGRAAPAPLYLALDPGGSLRGLPSRRLEMASTLTMHLMEPVPVDVEAHLEPTGDGRFRVSWKVEGGEGDRTVSIRDGLAELARESGRAGDLLVDLERGAPLMVVDVATGVAAVAVAPRTTPR